MTWQDDYYLGSSDYPLSGQDEDLLLDPYFDPWDDPWHGSPLAEAESDER